MRTRFICLAMMFVLLCSTVSAQWVQTSGPAGGDVYCFFNNGTFLYAGTSDGVYRSSDQGLSWKQSNMGLTETDIFCFTTDGTRLFAGASSSIFVSTDGGDSWALSNSVGRKVSGLVAYDGIVFGGGTSGLFVSTNSGQVWNPLNTLPSAWWVTCLAVDGKSLFTGTYPNGMYVSTDYGTTWAQMTPGLTVSTAAYALARSGNSYFVGTNNGVLRCLKNGSSTWTSERTGLSGVDVKSLSMVGMSLFAGTDGSGVFVSSDGGTTWTPSIVGLPAKQVYALQSVGGGDLLAGAIGCGVFLSINSGSSWAPSNHGFVGTNEYALATSGDTLFAGTTSGDVARSMDGGISWTSAHIYGGFPNASVFALAVSGTTVVAGAAVGTGAQGFYLSTDAGTNWHNTYAGSDAPDVFAFAKSEGNLFAGTSIGVFLSTNGGNDWSILSSSLNGIYVRALISNETEVVAGTLNGTVSVSTDNGLTWSMSSLGSDVGALATVGSTLFAASDGAGVFRSTDNGGQWVAVNTGLETYRVLSLAVSRGCLFAGTYEAGGVYVSTDAGGSWNLFNTGLSRTLVFALGVTDTYLYAATFHGGVWKRPLSDVTSVSTTSAPLPSSFRLEQNYPNPFNPSTTIRYSLPHRSHVTLTVYNTLGQKVAELVNGDIDAGYHEIQFNATNLASGIYFYRIQTGSYVETKKLALIR